jgi:hypothetical protein
MIASTAFQHDPWYLIRLDLVSEQNVSQLAGLAS